MTSKEIERAESVRRRRLLSDQTITNGDIVIRVVSFMDADWLLSTGAFVCSTWSKSVKHDDLWREECQRRWKGMRLEQSWHRARRETGSLWIDAFKQSIRETYRALPIFAMGSRLNRHCPMGLNFFEPRYKWLIQRIIDPTIRNDADRSEFEVEKHADATTQLFVFCTHQPTEGSLGWITRACHINVRQDGGSDFIALPLARCTIKKLWTEEVSGQFSGNYNCPPLWCCTCEENPIEITQDSTAVDDDDDSWARLLPGVISNRFGMDRTQTLQVLQRLIQNNMMNRDDDDERDPRDLMTLIRRIVGVQGMEDDEEEMEDDESDSSGS